MTGEFGLYRWNRKEDKIDRTINTIGVSESQYVVVYIAGVDAQNNLWLINRDGEIIRYEIATGKMHLQLPQHRMNYIANMQTSIARNAIWISTDRGLLRFDTRTYELEAFDATDGMPPLMAGSTQKTMYVDTPGNRLYVGARYFIAALNGLQLRPAVNNARTLLLEGLSDGDTLFRNLSEKLRIVPNHKDVQVHFAVVNHLDPENNLVEYRLLSPDSTAWQAVGNNSMLSLHNLPPGHYLVQLRLSARNNRWPPQYKALTFNIKPPFWRRTWFKILMGALLIALLLLLYQLRMRRLQKKNETDLLLSGYEMKALHAQMNPHFIFNCLGSIKQMIQENDNAGASRYLGKFAKLIRLTLGHSTKENISLRENNDYLVCYFEMEQLRFHDAFHYKINIAADIDPDHVFIAPFMVQPLAENAIWHGLLNITEEKKMEISYSTENGMLVCKVSDNGIGIAEASKKPRRHESIGLENLSKRLQLLNNKYGYQCSLQLEDKKTYGEHLRGTIATLVLPLTKYQSH
jgi:hypothetical protein